MADIDSHKAGLDRKVDLAGLRQHYQAAQRDLADAAARLVSLGFGAAAFVMLFTAPALGAIVGPIFMGIGSGAMILAFFFRRRMFDKLREQLLEYRLNEMAPLPRAIWDRIARLKLLPAPIDQYVKHFLNTYIDLKRSVREDDLVDLGQVQLAQTEEHVLDFLDLAERTGAIRNIVENMGHRLSDEDQIKLRQRFSEQCAGLQEITQTFDRSLSNLLVAQVLVDGQDDTSMDYVQERMRSIEDEFAEVKDLLSQQN